MHLGNVKVESGCDRHIFAKIRIQCEEGYSYTKCGYLQPLGDIQYCDACRLRRKVLIRVRVLVFLMCLGIHSAEIGIYRTR